jgi:hypothetical protein
MEQLLVEQLCQWREWLQDHEPAAGVQIAPLLSINNISESYVYR